MNYVAIIGDIKSSKTIKKRNQIQEKLNIVLKYINEAYSPDIAAKFIITLGDAFQGLLKNYDHILDIAKYIQREMYPINLRFGIGVGEIYTDIFYEAAIGSDGPAYYAARDLPDTLTACCKVSGCPVYRISGQVKNQAFGFTSVLNIHHILLCQVLRLLLPPGL